MPHDTFRSIRSSLGQSYKLLLIRQPNVLATHTHTDTRAHTNVLTNYKPASDLSVMTKVKEMSVAFQVDKYLLAGDINETKQPA